MLIDFARLAPVDRATVPSNDVRPRWWRIVLSAAVGTNLLLASGHVGATERPVNAEASKFITDTVSAGLQILNDAQPDQPSERERHFAALMRRNVDVTRAARFVLGRYWNSSTDMERRRFADVYADYIAHAYGKALPYFRGTTLKVVGTIGVGEDIKVKTIFDHDRARPAACWNSTLHRNDPMCRDTEARWDVGWLLHRTVDGFKIVDVDVEGESLLLNQRDEFTSLIAREGGTLGGLTRIIEARLSGEQNS
jgi:phospholipid transport system substrate-binding protein